MALDANRIALLPKLVVERIAAGEVVERPASVVKELVENSIDAGAESISLVIEDAGFSLIRITDNGSGMSEGDLGRSILRHATSKIRQLDDLYALSTMGFRGEALASVAAVSRCEIVTSSSDDGLGSRLLADGGEVVETGPASHARGTTVVIRDLFYNTPARKKFMKTRRAERMALIKLFEEVVLSFPAVHFVLTVEGKPVLDAPVTSGLKERIAQICGTEFTKGLIECSGGFDGIDVRVLVSPPDEARARPRHQNVYVNLRRIDSDTVLHAVRNGYALMSGPQLRPSFFCFLDVNPEKVDVNVHPTKMKIKFEDENRLFSCVYKAVQQGLAQDLSRLPSAGEARPSGVQERQHATVAGVPRPGPDIPIQTSPDLEGTGNAGGADTDTTQTTIRFPGSQLEDQKELEQSDDTILQLTNSAGQESWDLIACYQIHDMFILAPIKNGILLIDQHAAHERVLFEQALESLAVNRSEAQQLLFPIVVNLSPTEKSVVDSNIESFRALGYATQDFGGDAIAVSAIPAFMRDSQVEDAIHEMIRYLLEERSVGVFPGPQSRLAAAYACGCAIKAGQRLSREEMNALLNSLFAAKSPYVCPHGRPTLVRMSLDELKRRFLR